MKFKSLFKVLFVLAIAITTVIVAESQDVKVTNEAKADCPVTETDVVNYLEVRGYQVIQAYPTSGSTWYACTYEPGGQPPEHWEITVTIVGCQITGYTRTWCASCP